MSKLTDKQERFCQLYIETTDASEAYRGAYDAKRMKPNTVNRKASELKKQPQIDARIKELQGEHREEHGITVGTLLDELEEARQAALTAETAQASAAVNATMSKAKLLGLDKQIIDLQSSDGSIKPVFNIVGVSPGDNSASGDSTE